LQNQSLAGSFGRVLRLTVAANYHMLSPVEAGAAGEVRGPRSWRQSGAPRGTSLDKAAASALRVHSQADSSSLPRRSMEAGDSVASVSPLPLRAKPRV